MVKRIEAKLIYGGHFDWLIRMACKNPPTNYKCWFLSKKEYTLEQAKDFRNERMRELEEAGLRKNGPRGFTTKNIGQR